MINLPPTQLAQARGNAYQLFSQLLLNGLTAETYEVLAKLPAFSATLPPFNADQAAADHYQLFQHNIFPYQSIFLDSSNLMGGDETERVSQLYAEARYRPTHEPDHMGQLLAFLSFLCQAEAEAWQDGLAQEAERMQGWQGRLFEAHLLRWLPAFSLAVQSHQNNLFTTLTNWLWQTVKEHTAHLTLSSTFTLPKAPDLLANDKTSVKDIANFLMTTPYAGIFLSRDNIGELARRLNIPRGFGDRGQMMANLFRAGAQFEEMPAFLQTFTTTLNQTLDSYTNLAKSTPHLAPFITPWQTCLTNTITMLQQISSKI